jgi:hypothetical protein
MRSINWRRLLAVIALAAGIGAGTGAVSASAQPASHAGGQVSQQTQDAWW